MNRDTLEKWLYYSLSAFALLLPFSITTAQPPAYLSAVLALILMWKMRSISRHPFAFRTVVWLFLFILVIASVMGVRPGHSLERLTRFIILAAAWAVPVIFVSEININQRPLDRLVSLFVLGLAFKAAYDFVRVPTLMSMGTPLFETATMRDPQFYLVGICLASGMIVSRAWSWRYPPVLVGLLMAMGGIIIHFKRGAWLSCLGGLAVMAAASKRWRPLGIAGLIICALVCIPQVRERMGQLEMEFAPDSGGRMILWTKVAPVLIAEHPFGMGWKAVTHADFSAISDQIELKLNHLHNNVLQITLELGWIGMGIWLFWMGSVIVVFWRGYKKMADQDRKTAGVALGGMGAFCGLMFNGLVEYNFGDSEIFMIIVLLMGLAAGVYQQSLREHTPRQPEIS